MRLAGEDLPYVLRRSVRRTFALQIDDRGIKVAVPGQARDEEIERFISGYAEWLLGKLAARRAQPAVAPFPLVDGACFPLLGQICRLRVGEGGRRTCWCSAADGIEELLVPSAHDVGTAIVRALRRRALPWFAGRLADFCERLGVAAPPLRLSSARTRWGSCSSTSGIRLHWRLIHLPPDLIDYVVAHEVAHLVEMNHSPRFWMVVGRLYPDWKAARVRLRAAGRALPVFGANAGDGFMNENREEQE